MKIFYELIKKL